MRASGLVSAFICTQKRRKRHLVQPDEEYEYLLEQPHCLVIGLFLPAEALAQEGVDLVICVPRNMPGYIVNLYPTPRIE